MQSLSIFDTFASISVGSISLATVFSAVLVFIICFIVIRILLSGITKAIGRTKLEAGPQKTILSIVRIALWVIAIIIVAESLGIPTSSLIAVVSIAGLALSLSIQNIMANLFSGLTLFFTRPCKVGDYIQIGANEGFVRRISLFYTVIETWDKRVISIPNSDVVAASLVNYSTSPMRRVDLSFCAAYSCSTEDVRAAILDAASMDSRITSDPEAPVVFVEKYGESAIQYLTRVWCKNEDYWDVYWALNENVRTAFAKHDVSVTFPHLNVHVVK